MRPRAVEAYEDGFNPRTARRAHGSWLGFVRAMGDFTPEQEVTYEHIGGFLEQLERTPMSKSYKMLVLQAILAEEALPGATGSTGSRSGSRTSRGGTRPCRRRSATRWTTRPGQELVDWRLTEYVDRHGEGPGADRIVCSVSHANGRPILFLPDRETQAGIPEGWRTVLADEEEYQAKFVKIALTDIELLTPL